MILSQIGHFLEFISFNFSDSVCVHYKRLQFSKTGILNCYDLISKKLSKFRLSNHKLLIETGRHMKLPITERICPVCMEGTEDEIHLLVRCNLYQSARQPLLDKCAELRPHFDFYSDKEKFQFIMTTPVLMGNVSKFVYSALNDRDIYQDVSITLNGILDKVPNLLSG